MGCAVKKEGIRMTSAIVSLKPAHPRVASEENNLTATRTYRTTTSFVAVHFDQAGKGKIVFLPKGAELRVIGPSSCLREGFEVMFEEGPYNVFEIDLVARCRLEFRSTPQGSTAPKARTFAMAAG
jgi:hypothetical protein